MELFFKILDYHLTGYSIMWFCFGFFIASLLFGAVAKAKDYIHSNYDLVAKE